MTIQLEIINAVTVYAPKEIEALQTKILVPKMVTRRRLTRAAKIAIYLAHEVGFEKGRIVYGSSFGELPATANILHAIHKEEGISPTHFQNSVYNTAVSYLSMLYGNQEEILTISSGDKTSEKVLKVGAVKALQGDTLLLMATETLQIEHIEEVNTCDNYLECGVALKVRLSEESSTLFPSKINVETKLPASLKEMFSIAQAMKKNQKNIIEITL